MAMMMFFNPYILSVAAGGGTSSEFPSAAMTANSTSLTDGTYVASSSSSANSGTPPYSAFDKVTASGWWASQIGSAYSSSSPYAYTGAVSTTVSGNSVTGEWLQIKFPAAVALSSYVVVSPADNNWNLVTPAGWVLCGSTNGTTWTYVETQTSVTWTGQVQTKTFTLSSNPYSYYRIIVTNASGNIQGGVVAIGELKFFGSLDTTVKYPPSGMTSASTAISGQTYGNGTYTVSTSTVYNGATPGWYTFTGSWGNNSWWSAQGVYNGSSPYAYGGSATTTVSGSSVGGEWIQMQMPSAIVLTRYSITSPKNGTDWQSNMSKTWRLAGSNDGTTWTSLDTRTQTWTGAAQTASFTISNSVAYSYYRLITTNTTGGAFVLMICDISFFA